MKNPLRNPFRKYGAIKPMTIEEAQRKFEGVELEKKDLPAMILAALITFLPALLIAIGLLGLFAYWFFVR